MKLLIAFLLIFLTQYVEAFALVNFKTTKESGLPAVLKAKIVTGDQINGEIIQFPCMCVGSALVTKWIKMQ